MAHFLDGDWRMLVITFPLGTPTLTPDGTFHLRHGATNELDNTSTHGGNTLTGSSVPDGTKIKIKFVEKVPAGTAFKFRLYTGGLVDHKLVGVELQKMIGGIRGPLLDNPPELDADAALLAGQNDGIWVGTQP